MKKHLLIALCLTFTAVGAFAIDLGFGILHQQGDVSLFVIRNVNSH